MQLVRHKNDKKIKVSYPYDFFSENEKMRVKNEKTKTTKNFCARPPSGNQVEGLPLALHKDAESASWLRSGRATIHKI